MRALGDLKALLREASNFVPLGCFTAQAPIASEQHINFRSVSGTAQTTQQLAARLDIMLTEFPGLTSCGAERLACQHQVPFENIPSASIPEKKNQASEMLSYLLKTH